MKDFYTQYNIGKCKYVVSHYNGIDKHKDGSQFYNIAIFKNKKDLNSFTSDLVKSGFSNKY